MNEINSRHDKEVRLILSLKEENSIEEDVDDALAHGLLVTKIVSLLTKELNTSKRLSYEIEVAAMLHDIGKIKLGEYLYGRHEQTMGVEEVRYMRMHPNLSCRVLRRKANYPEHVLNVIYHHHENVDGTGYPDNLTGDYIPYGAKVLRPCDVFAALVSERPYRSAFDIKTSIEMMIDEFKHFDMKIFLAFMNVVNSEEFDVIREFVADANAQSFIRFQKNEVSETKDAIVPKMFETDEIEWIENKR